MITELTKEQEAKFPEYVRKWIGHGTCTDPADRPRAEAAIRWMYKNAGLAVPRIVWAESPLSGALTVGSLKNSPASVWDSVWASVRDSVWDSVGASVGASVRDSVGDSVGASVWGQHEASWLSFYRFFHDECGLIDQTSKMYGLWELCQSCGWIFPYEGICIATERHSICKLDGNGVIHSDSGPAIAYPDGFEIYAWHDVRVPGEWINTPDKINPADILAVEDVEQRAAGAEIIGWDRMAEKLDRRVIEGDPNTDIGALVEMTLPGLSRPGRFLMAQCPRNGTICEGVPYDSDIDGHPINTAIAAQAWRDGLPVSEYQHPEIRT